MDRSSNSRNSSKTIDQKNNWDLTHYAKDLSNRHILLVGAKQDNVVPISTHHNPLVEALKSVNAKYLTDVILEDDHVFSDSRIKLAKIILAWLNKLN